MRYLITSDIHLGSKYSRIDAFSRMLTGLKEDVRIVIAGDLVDAPDKPMPPEHMHVFNDLLRHPGGVVWVIGNHDDGVSDSEQISNLTVTDFSIDKRLYVCHGDSFDNVMPHNRWFIILFKWLHKIRMMLGAAPVHVAHYAKKFGMLYAFLRNNVRRNAIEHALENAFTAVACGHVHFAEHTESEGVTYYNFGAWTDAENYVLLVDDDDIRFLSLEDAVREPDWFREGKSPKGYPTGNPGA